MKAKFPKLGGLLCLMGLLALGVGAYLKARMAPASAQPVTPPTSYPNVTVSFAPSADGNGRLTRNGGLIYRQPGQKVVATARAAAVAPVEQRGRTAAGGYYVTLPSSRYPRAEAQVTKTGKTVTVCTEPASAQHHEHGAQSPHVSIR